MYYTVRGLQKPDEKEEEEEEENDVMDTVIEL